MAPADSSSSLSGPVPGFGAAPSLDVPPPAAPSFTPNSATDSQTDDFDEKLLLGFPENRGKRKANRYVHDRKRLAKWDRRYIELAAHVGSWSKDPNAKVGCVIVSPTFGRAVTFSFNGFPANVADNEERLTGKKSKLGRILHAEQNALLYAGREARGCHAYVVGKPVCNVCATLLIQAGIRRVIATAPRAVGEYDPPDPTTGKTDWEELGRLALTMFEEAGVEFVPIDKAENQKLIGKYGLQPNERMPDQPCSCCEHHKSS